MSEPVFPPPPEATPPPAVPPPAVPEPGAPAAAAPADPPRGSGLRRILLVVLLVAGLAGVGGGGGALATELTRAATPAEVAAAARAEVASRWERLTAQQIFPARISYTSSQGVATYAQRVGIAPRASCAAGLDPAVAKVVIRHGCLALLRATYVDASGTLLATIGIAVLPSAAAATRIENGSSWTNAGVRAVAFPGTVAGQFTDAARQAFSVQYAGPYLFFVSSGYADGRRGHNGVAGPMGDLNLDLPDPIVTALTVISHPCARKDITC